MSSFYLTLSILYKYKFLNKKDFQQTLCENWH
jgi:hypothetical protein